MRHPKEATGALIQRELEKAYSSGAIHTALDRLAKKGFVNSELGDPLPSAAAGHGAITKSKGQAAKQFAAPRKHSPCQASEQLREWHDMAAKSKINFFCDMTQEDFYRMCKDARAWPLNADDNVWVQAIRNTAHHGSVAQGETMPVFDQTMKSTTSDVDGWMYTEENGEPSLMAMQMKYAQNPGDHDPPVIIDDFEPLHQKANELLNRYCTKNHSCPRASMRSCLA